MSASPLPFRVIRCADWGAVQPKGAIPHAGKPNKTIFHHTAGHVPNKAPGETYAEAVAYARSIQKYHMNSNGWIDSGHNFLVTRGGFILEGRHGSLDAVRAGNMVVSAHCPGQNDQPGIEHEHTGNETMTAIQREASVWLHSQLCKWGKISPADCAQPHKAFFSTACPGSLAAGLGAFRKDVAAALTDDQPSAAWWAKYTEGMPPKWQRKLFAALREAQRRYGSG